MRSAKLLTLGVLLAVSLSLMGCQKNITGTSTCCDSFQIIRPSRDDTNGTKRQVYEHNKVYEAVCEDE